MLTRSPPFGSYDSPAARRGGDARRERDVLTCSPPLAATTHLLIGEVRMRGESKRRADSLAALWQLRLTCC